MDGVLRKVKPEGYGSSSEVVARGLAVSEVAAPVVANQNDQAADLFLAKLSDKFIKFLSSNPSEVEVNLAAMSFLETIATFANDGSPMLNRNESSLKEALTNISAEKSIIDAAVDLYKNCKNKLLETVRCLPNSTEDQNFLPSNLIVEELESILTWFKNRTVTLELTKSTTKLGQEGFFGVKVFHDVERFNIFGFLVRGGIDLDSRGDDELWLVSKLICQGKVVYESEERPIGTLGERKVGRLLLDSFEQFIPYSNIQWPKELNGKIASCICVVSVLDRTGATCFSTRINENIRKTKDPLSCNKPTMQIPMDITSGDSLLKGHKILNLQLLRTLEKISVVFDCVVMNQSKKPVTLIVSVVDKFGDVLNSEEFSLQCVTRIARFYEIESSFTDQDSIDCASHIEITILAYDNKELCCVVGVL